MHPQQKMHDVVLGMIRDSVMLFTQVLVQSVEMRRTLRFISLSRFQQFVAMLMSVHFMVVSVQSIMFRMPILIMPCVTQLVLLLLQCWIQDC